MWAIVRVFVRELEGSSCSLILSICTIPRGGIGTAAFMVLSWKSNMVWKYSLLIRFIYTGGQVTCNGSTTLQDHMRHVLQHSHGRTTHEYKEANHLATLEIRATLLRINAMLRNVVRMFVRPNATNWIAKCCLWILNMFKSQRRPDATILSHETNAMHPATEATGRTNC